MSMCDILLDYGMSRLGNPQSEDFRFPTFITEMGCVWKSNRNNWIQFYQLGWRLYKSVTKHHILDSSWNMVIFIIHSLYVAAISSYQIAWTRRLHLSRICFKRRKLTPFGMLKVVVVAFNMLISIMSLRVNLQHTIVDTNNVFYLLGIKPNRFFALTTSWHRLAVSPFCKRLPYMPQSTPLTSQAGISSDAASMMSWEDFPFRD